MKCSIMLHFIWVFTVCQSSRLGVSSIQRDDNNGAFTLKASITTKNHSAFVIDLLNVLEASWSNSVYLDKTSPL